MTEGLLAGFAVGHLIWLAWSASSIASALKLIASELKRANDSRRSK